MSTPLKSQFDRLVEKARLPDCKDPLDFTLGSLFALEAWCFHNTGPANDPSPAAVELEGTTHLLVFSDTEHLDDFTVTTQRREAGSPLNFFLVPLDEATHYCLKFAPLKVDSILVNPGPFSFAVTLDVLKNFYEEWKAKGGQTKSSFHVPNNTTFDQEFFEANEGAILSGENILRPGSSGFDQFVETIVQRARQSGSN